MNRTIRHEEYLHHRLISRIIIHVPAVIAGVPIEDDLTVRAAGLLIYRDCLQSGLQADYQRFQNIKICEYTPEGECLTQLSAQELENIKRTLSDK